MKARWRFIALIGIIGLAIICVLSLRWEIDWSPLYLVNYFSSFLEVAGELLLLLGVCLAASLLPGLILFGGLCMISNRYKMPTTKIMLTLGVLCSGVSLFCWVLIWKEDHMHQLANAQSKIDHQIEAECSTLRKEGRNEEIVQLLEQSLEIQEKMISIRGLGHESCNHGYSYLFVTLHPVSQDLPRQLGWSVTYFLYDAWHDGEALPKDDKLAVALTHSKHPLLRAIGYWVLQDYKGFEREAMAGAKAGDVRMDSLALVAACAFASDKEAALQAVRPILDRGVGLGIEHGTYSISSDKIRSYLKGRAARSYLEPILSGYFMYPPN